MVMDDEPNVRFVDPHPEGDGRYNNLALASYPLSVDSRPEKIQGKCFYISHTCGTLNMYAGFVLAVRNKNQGKKLKKISKNS